MIRRNKIKKSFKLTFPDKEKIKFKKKYKESSIKFLKMETRKLVRKIKKINKLKIKIMLLNYLNFFLSKLNLNNTYAQTDLFTSILNLLKNQNQLIKILKASYSSYNSFKTSMKINLESL